MVTSIRQAAKVRRKGSKEEPGWKKSLELKWGEVRTFEQNWKCGEGGGEDSALANHWLQNEINTALNENVSM